VQRQYGDYFSTFILNEAGLVVTMGCSVEEACPRPMLAQMQKKLVDWNLSDPKGKSIDEVRAIAMTSREECLGHMIRSR